jgi:hypothetical protein
VLPEEGLDPAERAERLAAAGTPVIGARLKIDSDGQILARTATGKVQKYLLRADG